MGLVIVAIMAFVYSAIAVWQMYMDLGGVLTAQLLGSSVLLIFVIVKLARMSGYVKDRIR
jgi:uncharacterized membrane protein (DUF373 family)